MLRHEQAAGGPSIAEVGYCGEKLATHDTEQPQVTLKPTNGDREAVTPAIALRGSYDSDP
jgi:hypothetical protein